MYLYRLDEPQNHHIFRINSIWISIFIEEIQNLYMQILVKNEGFANEDADITTTGVPISAIQLSHTEKMEEASRHSADSIGEQNQRLPTGQAHNQSPETRHCAPAPTPHLQAKRPIRVRTNHVSVEEHCGTQHGRG